MIISKITMKNIPIFLRNQLPEQSLNFKCEILINDTLIGVFLILCYYVLFRGVYVIFLRIFVAIESDLLCFYLWAISLDFCCIVIVCEEL